MAKQLFQVEGVDYTPEGIEALRQECITWRENAMAQWPESIPFTVGITQVIALLSYLKEMIIQQ